MWLPDKQAHLLSLALVKLEHEGQGNEYKRRDNSEDAIRPSPRSVVQEGLRRDWAGERGDDERSTGETECKGTVAHTGSIRDEDIENQVDGVVSDPVEHVACCVGIGVVAGGEDNQSDHVYSDEEEEAFRAAPDVQQAGDGELEDASDDAGEDVGCAQLGGGFEVDVGFLNDVGADRGLQCEDEEGNPDPMLLA